SKPPRTVGQRDLLTVDRPRNRKQRIARTLIGLFEIARNRRFEIAHRVVLDHANGARQARRIGNSKATLGSADIRNERRAHIGSHANTSPERSSGVKEGRNAALSCSSIFSGVQPSERWMLRIGRGWLNSRISLLRTPNI